MGRSPAPVARGPRAVCSLPATRRALIRRPSHPLPPPGGPSRRAPTSRGGPRPPGARSGLAPSRGLRKRRLDPTSPWSPCWDEGRGGSQARLPARLEEGGEGSAHQTWAGGNHLRQAFSSPPLFHSKPLCRRHPPSQLALFRMAAFTFMPAARDLLSSSSPSRGTSKEMAGLGLYFLGSLVLSTESQSLFLMGRSFGLPSSPRLQPASAGLQPPSTW